MWARARARPALAEVGGRFNIVGIRVVIDFYKKKKLTN